jgi:membrane-associated protease RseP (regulator of RpoE activity)
MDLGWLIPVLTAVMIYACICFAIIKYNILPNTFSFMGPCLMIKTIHTGIFDKLSRWKRLLIAYGNLGVILTVISSVVVTLLFVFTAFMSLFIDTEPIAPQNLLLIPGINDYVPSTFAVWFALIFAMVIHEFGHGFLSRVENIKVKSAGVLALVIPIGAFVEPDEEDIAKSSLGTKLRMYAAGITNNLLVGGICVLLLVLLLGLVVPGTSPYVYGVYAGYPAEEAGVMPGTIIFAIDNTSVSSLADISAVLATTKANQTITLHGEYRGTPQTYDITLTSIPPDLAGSLLVSGSDSGFIGVSFSEPSVLTNALHTLMYPSSPLGAAGSLLTFIALPFSSIAGSAALSFLIVDTPDPAILAAPFTGFWEIIHILYWCAWINILLGIFNALPLGPFDGGQMLRESLRSWFVSRGKDEKTAFSICRSISYVLVLLIVIPLVMPYLL